MRVRTISPRCGERSICFADVVLPVIVLRWSCVVTLTLDSFFVVESLWLLLVLELLLLLLLDEPILLLLLLVFMSLQFLLVSKQHLAVLFVLRRNNGGRYQQDEWKYLWNEHSMRWRAPKLSIGLLWLLTSFMLEHSAMKEQCRIRAGAQLLYTNSRTLKTPKKKLSVDVILSIFQTGPFTNWLPDLQFPITRTFFTANFECNFRTIAENQSPICRGSSSVNLAAIQSSWRRVKKSTSSLLLDIIVA